MPNKPTESEQLTKLRAGWERGLAVLAEIKGGDSLLVILCNEDDTADDSANRHKFHCHHYFTLTGPARPGDTEQVAHWQCSCDKQCVTLGEVWRWVEDRAVAR